MRRVTRIGSCVAFVTALLGAPAWANPTDADVIDYRQQIMKTKDAQAAAIGQILATMVPNNNIASHFEVLLLAVRQSRAAFKPKVLGGGAQPAIWENWDDFSARLDLAEKNIVEAINQMRTNGLEQAGEAAISALSCRGCHDIYRKKD